jgi:hypothetical protein
MLGPVIDRKKPLIESLRAEEIAGVAPAMLTLLSGNLRMADHTLGMPFCIITSG